VNEPSTYLLRRLDDPWMLAFVELDVGLIGGMVCFIGIVSGHFVLGLVAGYIVGFLYHKGKVGRPRGGIKHIAYRLFPPFVVPLRATPPSFHEEMYG
jgi:type IV conjugative transfer system protein TraL